MYKINNKYINILRLLVDLGFLLTINVGIIIITLLLFHIDFYNYVRYTTQRIMLQSVFFFSFFRENKILFKSIRNAPEF